LPPSFISNTLKRLVIISLHPCIIIILFVDGLGLLKDLHPDVEIFLGTVDETLSDANMILPGFGDAGDRLFGTPLDDVADADVVNGKRKHTETN
jgi:uracil phosphoribosyltransferase